MHRRYPYGPLHLRIVMPIVGIVVGILFAVRGIGRAGDGDPLFLILGVVLVVLGIVAIPLARWMAKRGIRDTSVANPKGNPRRAIRGFRVSRNLCVETHAIQVTAELSLRH